MIEYVYEFENALKVEAAKIVREEMSQYYYLEGQNVKDVIDRRLKGKALKVFEKLLERDNGELATFIKDMSFNHYVDMASTTLEDDAFVRMCKTCDGHGCQHCEDDHG